MVTNKSPKISTKFYCKCCDYGTSKQSEYNKHLMTAKHQMVTNGYKKSPDVTRFVCECGKTYKHRQGLSRHKNKCSLMSTIENYDNIDSTNIIDSTDTINSTGNTNNNLIIQALNQNKELINENKELQRLVMQQSKQMTAQSKQISELIPKVGNNNNNTIKNKFNIQVFLNETCKDAMSITDFTNSLQLRLEDIMYSKERGTIEGLSKIIVRGLNELDVEKRPVHCTDVKRETLYIKDNEGWEKETKDQAKMKQLITKTQQKHGQLLSDWQKAHPDWESSEAQTSEFHDLVCRLCYPEGGENKIIKNIAKEVIIEK